MQDEEDLEGGLDEDWGHDVDVIELQNRLPDHNSSKASGRRGKSKSRHGRRAAAEVEAVATEVVEQAAAAAALRVADGAINSDSTGKEGSS